MSRRVSRELRGAFVALLAVVALFAPASARAVAPNVLFIVTDDQALETMQIADPAMDPMPKTKEWFHTGGTSDLGSFEGGTFYRDAVSTTPLCCPARASIFTGRYAHNHGVTTNVDSPGPPATHVPTGGSALDTSTTLARYLHDAGYYTGIFGKYLNGWDLSKKPDDPYNNWDEWAIFDNPGPGGSYEVNDQGMRKYEFRYESDVVAARGLDFLRRAHADRDGVPWFLYLAPSAPHAPFSPPPRHAGAPVPPLDQSDPAYLEPDRSDKPPWTRTSLLEADIPEKGWPDHLRMLKSVDDMVDSVMRELQSEGREDRGTIAFFVSDNGLLWGEHGLYGKNLSYTESVRVPFMVRWPDGPVAQNFTSDRLVSNIDMAPTIVDAVNDAFGSTVIPPNPAAPMDGMSLVDPGQPDRDAILTEGWGMGPPAGTRGYCLGVSPSWAALTTNGFHYIENYETRPLPPPGGTTPAPGCSAREYETLYDNPPIFKEYYDRRQGHDPEEVTNLLADDNAAPNGTAAQLSRLVDDGAPENDPPTGSLHARLAQLRTCEGQACVPQSGDPTAVPVEVALTAKPTDPSGFRDVSFSFTATQPGAKFRCSLDGAPSRLCESPILYTRLRGGRHHFRVTGSANGTSQSKVHAWSVDRELPDARIEAKPRKSATVAGASFEFAGSEVADSFTCQLDAEAPMPCTSPQEYTELGEGDHTFTLVAHGLGSQDPTPETFTWRVDTVAPDTGLARSATFSANSTAATFSLSRTFAAGDPGFLGRYYCSLDGGAWKSCDTAKTFTRLPPGHRTLDVKATDVAGNEDATPAHDEWDLGPIQLFSSAADIGWPDISQGTEVSDIVPDGNGGWYVAGSFTQLSDADGEHFHTDLAHITSAKTVDDTWNPSTDGAVRSIVLSPDRSTLYAGGTFRNVGAGAFSQDTERDRLAAFSTTTGDPTAWAPEASNEVSRLAVPPATFGVQPTTLYAAGSFNSLRPNGGQSIVRRKVAEIALAGDATPTSWNPNVNSTATLVALAVTERHVYVGGMMTSVGGSPSPNPIVPRTNLAAIDRTDAKATSWAPDPDGTVFSLHVSVRDEALDTILAGGSFTHIGNPPAPRSHAAELSLSDDGSATAWDPSLEIAGQPGSARAFVSSGCDFTAAKIADPSCATLIGGAFDSVSTGGGGRATRIRLAQVDRVSGFAQDWSPNVDQAALSMACWPPALVGSQARCDNSPARVLAVGGTFTNVGTVPRGRLAFFPRP